ncbi:MAG: hypothetical protein M3044_06555 [Thermoproteota archaeon]|nr:hypothetical protein [Thermoproteota archaeon]
MTEVITFSVSKELREKVDHQRGDIARSKFISRLIEDAIGRHTRFPTTTGQSLTRSDRSVGESQCVKGGTLDE